MEPPDLPAFAEVMRALGDDTRLRILRALGPAALCVCDLAEAVGASQPLVSHHLKALKGARLVSCSRDGPWVYYAVRPETFARFGLAALWAEGGILTRPAEAPALVPHP